MAADEQRKRGRQAVDIVTQEGRDLLDYLRSPEGKADGLLFKALRLDLSGEEVVLVRVRSDGQPVEREVKTDAGKVRVAGWFRSRLPGYSGQTPAVLGLQAIWSEVRKNMANIRRTGRRQGYAELLAKPLMWPQVIGIVEVACGGDVAEMDEDMNWLVEEKANRLLYEGPRMRWNPEAKA